MGIEGIMGHIHCCGGLRKARTFLLQPQDNYMYAQADYLDFCPVCGHTVLQLTRIGKDYKVSSLRKTNEKARRFFEKIKPYIKEEKNPEIYLAAKYYSKFYLYYNEYGKRKKCYSNLSTMKLGKFENI